MLWRLGIGVVVVGGLVLQVVHSLTWPTAVAWIYIGGVVAVVAVVRYGTRYRPLPAPMTPPRLSEREWALREARAELTEIQRAAGLPV